MDTGLILDGDIKFAWGIPESQWFTYKLCTPYGNAWDSTTFYVRPRTFWLAYTPVQRGLK